MEDLPVYQSHKKVGAAKIIDVTLFDDGVTKLGLVLPTGHTMPDGWSNVTRILVDAAWMQRNPKTAVGGYFVCYIENEDKYTAYSPAEPFEAGYKLVCQQGMTRQEALNGLVKDINNLIDDYRKNKILTYAEIVGVLEMIKFDVINEVTGA